jgi:hypothetical protein
MLMHFLQAHPGPTAILIDEFDAGRFESAANGQVVGRRHGGLGFGEFGPADRGDTESGLSSEVFGTPTEESTGGSNLRTSQRL